MLKSNAKTTTYGLLESKSVTECRKAIRAAVVEPVGRKAYWSVKLSGVGGVMMARGILAYTGKYR